MAYIFNNLANKRIAQVVFSKYSKISVNAGECRYNFRCADNAVHEAINNSEDNIAMVIYFEDYCPVIHFINIDKEGNYTDNTLGHWSQRMAYYLVRTIPKDSFWDIHDIFAAFRLELHRQLPFYARLFISLDRF